MSQEKQPFVLQDKFTEVVVELEMLKLLNFADHMLDGVESALEEVKSSSISGPVYYPNKESLILILEEQQLHWCSMIDEIVRVEEKLKKLLVK